MSFGKDDDIKRQTKSKKKLRERKRIVVAPLNWGLGHATRCIPIIRELIAQGMEVVVAADGRPLDLLKKEFPSLVFYRLSGFAPSYNKKGATVFHMIRQIPALIKATIIEHRAIQRLVHKEKISAIISDSRFGLFTKKIPTVYIVHQVRILLPLWLRLFERAVYFIHRLIITQYTECWIPDYDGTENLSGKLAHSFLLPRNAKFIGPLTRFTRKKSQKIHRDILAILSGPEPQRTVFEKLIVNQLLQSNFNALIVRGMPEIDEYQSLSQTVLSVSTLPAEELNNEILSSEIILSRPGYSTVMDLAALGKKAIFIPTPGQTEQEYLAEYFHEKKICFSMDQKEFDLNVAMKSVSDYRGFIHNEIPSSVLAEIVTGFVTQLQDD
jgi:uncharacterized protein (TIGR00661 family)